MVVRSGRSVQLAARWKGVLVIGAAAGGIVVAGCFGSTNGGGTGRDGDSGPPPATRPDEGTRWRASDALREYPLDTLPTATVTVAGHALRAWVAHESAPRAPGARRTRIEEGLMFVPPEELADDQGMLFVFNDEQVRGFWMLNTVTPLDIAFARADGTIVTIWQMPPRTLRTFSSLEPAMFALEVRQGTLAALGVDEGDVLEVPQEALRPPGG